MKNNVQKIFLGNSLYKLFGAFALAILVLLACPQMEAQAKTTITVKSVNQATAKKVHKQLTKGKEFDIRIPGNEQAFHAKFKKLGKKIAKCSDYGFDIYPIIYAGRPNGEFLLKDGGYIRYAVTTRECQEYIYGIKYAKRQVKDLKKRINEIIADSNKICKALEKGTIEVQPGQKSKKKLLSDTKKTIANLKELKKYLTKTKFRNLSEAMKARILLDYGYAYNRPWGEVSMVHHEVDGSGYLTTFKALYQRKAHGTSLNSAILSCKIAAVFGIGDFDFLLKKFGDAGSHRVARVKVKTLGKKTRYAVVDCGVFEDYDSYAKNKYEVYDYEVHYREKYKKRAPIKKIKKSQQLKAFGLNGRLYDASDSITGKDVRTYYFNLSKSEW